MKINTQLLILAVLPLTLASCQNHYGQQEPQSIVIDTLHVSELELIVSTESALLGEPREIVAINEQQFAVYDHAYKKIIVFDNNGDKLNEFGNVGEGPGEWDAMAGAAEIDFVSDRFFTTNKGRFLFDLYDRSGNHIRSISFPQYLYFSHKSLLPDEKLLITTNGRENALAVVMDLNEEEEIIQRIGTPESEYSEGQNFEQERTAYSNGDIPKSDLNRALAARGKDGYFLFMNTLGELRLYSEEGDLIFNKEIPDFIKTTVFDFIIHQNKEEVPKNSVMPLKYARELKVHDDLIYLYMPKPHPEADLDFRMLVYDSNGELLKHYVFVDNENESFLYDFAISEDNHIYFIDVMSAEILRFSPDRD